MTASPSVPSPDVQEANDLTRILLAVSGLIVLDVVSQFPLAVYPFDTIRPGWRLTTVQIAATQFLPLAMALLLFAMARIGSGGSWRPIRLACWALAAAALLVFWYLAVQGVQIVESASLDLYPRMRIGLLRELGESGVAALGFGMSAFLLGRLVPDSSPPAYDGL